MKNAAVGTGINYAVYEQGRIVTTPRSPADLADAIESAHNFLIRWNDYDALRTLRWEEKDMIVAALRAYSPSAADSTSKEK